MLERVDANGGRIKIKGEIWSARSLHAGRLLRAGPAVEVVEIDGATAVVYVTVTVARGESPNPGAHSLQMITVVPSAASSPRVRRAPSSSC